VDKFVVVSPIILAFVTSLISSPFEIGVGPKPITIEDPSTQKAI
jgi:hypothetical protein